MLRIPPRVRELLEIAIRARALTYIASTTTLAEGVDLPFRVVVLHDWMRGYGDHQHSHGIAPVSKYRRTVRQVRRIFGGDTILFDNVLGSLRYTHQSVRQRWQLTLFADPPALKSAIANDNLPEDERKRIKAVVASQLLAAIPEHPESENLDELLASTLYASFAGKSERTRTMLRRMRRELLDASFGEPFAVAASPMRLTDLGERANATGLSPGTCRILLQFTWSDMAGKSWQSICVALLLALTQCPEQQNGNLTAMAQDKQKRFFVGRKIFQR